MSRAMVVMAVLALTCCATAQEKPPKKEKEIDPATVVAFKDLGADLLRKDLGADLFWRERERSAWHLFPGNPQLLEVEKKRNQLAILFADSLGTGTHPQAGTPSILALQVYRIGKIRLEPDLVPIFSFIHFPTTELPSVEVPFGLVLEGTRVKEVGVVVKKIGGMKNLSYLALGRTKVTDEEMKDLARLKTLRYLDLSGANVTGDGLKHLAGLKKLSSLVLTDYQLTDSSMKTLRELGLLHTLSQATAKGNERPRSSDEIVSFGLSNLTKVTATGLKELAGLKNLSSLSIHHQKLTDSVLKSLREVGMLHTLPQATKTFERPRSSTEIVSLNLMRTPVTDAGLKELAGLVKLSSLYLQDTQVTDAGLKELAGMKNLGSLDLSFTKVTGTGLKDLAGLEKLSALNLSNTQVTDVGMKELAGFVKLTSVDLCNTKVTDAGLKELSVLKNLSSLDLAFTKVTDTGLKELAVLKNLTSVNLRKTRVTAAGIAILKKELPRCHIGH